MAVAQTTILPALIGGTAASNNTLALSTGEQEWAFTTAVRTVIIQFISDAAWLYSSQASGGYVLVPANVGFTIPIGPAQSVFVKSVAATPTLYCCVVG